MKDLKAISGSTPELVRLQSNLDAWATSVLRSGLNNGLLLKNVVLGTGAVNTVEHKLGRELSGWIVVRQRANAQIWDSQDANVFKTKSLALECSANVTIDLWVF